MITGMAKVIINTVILLQNHKLVEMRQGLVLKFTFCFNP